METKERIIRGAMEQFLKQGVKAVTMDDVASNLGVSKRTIYENFSDKPQLLKECLLYRSCLKKEEIDGYARMTVVEVLRKMIQQSDANIVEGQYEYRLFQELKKYYPDLHHEVVERFRQDSLQQTQRYIESGKQEGIFLTTTDTQMASYILIEQLEYFARSDKFSTFTELHKLMGHVIIIFFRGISTCKGIAEADAILQSYSETAV